MPFYDGRRITPEDVHGLNDDGLAGFSVNSIELGCHGVSAYFDTEAGADRYGAGYRQRSKRVHAQRLAAEASGTPSPDDPCGPWREPIPELPGA